MDTIIEIKEFDGSIINRIKYADFNDFIYDFRGRPFIDEKRPPKMSAVEMMEYIANNHLETAFNKTATALYKRFGIVGATLIMYVTIICFFDTI